MSSLTPRALREYFDGAYTADRMVVTVAGHAEHGRVRELMDAAFGGITAGPGAAGDVAPIPTPHVILRTKDLEQSHVCLGIGAYPQQHPDRHVLLVLNTVLGGSMSSRLFQNVREKRGLAYSVGSGISAFGDAGVLTVYAGCANEKVAEVVEVVLGELAAMVRTPIAEYELQRAKDNVKGGLFLGLESTWHRAAFLARQEIFFDGAFTIDEVLDGIARVSVADISRVSRDMLTAGPFSLSVLGDVPELPFTLVS